MDEWINGVSECVSEGWRGGRKEEGENGLPVWMHHSSPCRASLPPPHAPDAACVCVCVCARACVCVCVEGGGGKDCQ